MTLQWDSKSTYRQIIQSPMCSHCGRRSETDNALTTVIDWRTDSLCAICIASFDWSDWDYNPDTKTFTHK